MINSIKFKWYKDESTVEKLKYNTTFKQIQEHKSCDLFHIQSLLTKYSMISLPNSKKLGIREILLNLRDIKQKLQPLLLLMGEN